ncbi:MAG: glycosyltransferase [Patescibacteria group bacterium]|nr:glycosyltransferase [Patescibacteria group bacterium]
MPGFLLFLILKAKIPINKRPKKGLKVALITPCVPDKESIEIIEKQLAALVAVEYPHDSWILDEGNDKQIKKLAKSYGVKYFSRKGKNKYNQEDYPFMAKTKSGNVNAWLHHTKRYKYEFFVQLDIDHLPKRNYLDKTLGQFKDESVGWVQAPSVYNNLQYWAARGSAEQELGFNGPVQMGFYGNAGAPVIIGSHTTFRMKAVQSIGGFQPTRAEDHLNTLALMAEGWNGVFIPEIIAEGDGPETFNTYIAQQYAWARSMTIILYRYSYRHIRKLSRRRIIQYLFIQTWYPATTFTYLTFFLVPVIALLTNVSPTKMNVFEFLLRFPVILLSGVACYWVGRPLLQPNNVKISWRGTLLHVIRWPIILQAMLGVLFRRKKSYQITPKGSTKRPYVIPPVRLYAPFLFLSSICALAIIYSTIFYGYRLATGQFIFASMNLVAMLSLCLLDLNLRLREGMLRFIDWLRPVSAVAFVTLLAGMAMALPFSPNQTTLALSTTPEPAPAHKADITQVPPQLLSDSELKNEIANASYRLASQTPPAIGIHNGDVVLPTDGAYIRHTFIDWRENRQLAEQMLLSERAGATSLLTIEPKGENDGAKLLSDITSGVYDDRLNSIFDIISANPNTVYVRFAHEMDLPEIYPWGNQDPEAYISAYQHVVQLSRSRNVTNIDWVWSPAGTQNAELYYPGDDNVDIVGTTMLYDSYFSGDYVPNFGEIQAARTHLFDLGKPVWIAELAIGKENTQVQTDLLASALQQYRGFGYSALIYLDVADVNIIGPDYTIADLNSLGLPLKHDDAKTQVESPVKQAMPDEHLASKSVLHTKQIFNTDNILKMFQP